MHTIAIIGAGPGGLVAAKYLKKEGFSVVLFEQGERLGGQWAGNARYSAVWPSMRTNTSSLMTAFSDLQHGAGEAVYPSNQAVWAYLQRYAEEFDLVSGLRLQTRVREVVRDSAGRGWVVRSTNRDGTLREEIYPHVIVATGRYHKPKFPSQAVQGFSGRVTHSFEFKSPESFRGQCVLVIGCSISALEIATELAMSGDVRVFSTSRRQRYILSKMLAGVPAECVIFTRYRALAMESLPVRTVAQELRELVVGSSGSPEQFGALKPADDILEAGLTQSQHFLPLVAEGKIQTRPWISAIQGKKVQFKDESTEQIDALVCATGYELDLPFLGPELRGALRANAQQMDLYKLTFHPDLPGLAFIGLFDLLGPLFPVLELQARWIAYLWSGALPALSPESMRTALTAYPTLPMNTAALLFAREAGLEPEIWRWPELTRALFFGPLSPISFRLSGRDNLPEAPQRIVQDASMFGAVPSLELTPKQRSQLQSLAAARKDEAMAALFAMTVSGK